MDISFKTEQGHFNYRVAGLIIHKDQILIMKDETSPYYYIPGGRVSLHESAENAIKREIKEELRIDVKVNRMLWIAENFFVEETNGETFHEVAFYFLLDLVDTSIFERRNPFVLKENGEQRLRFYWKPIRELKELYMYPLFLKERILTLPQTLEHIIERRCECPCKKGAITN